MTASASLASKQPTHIGRAEPDDALQREKLSTLGHMASSIAHDISNPLAAIATCAQGILTQWPGGGVHSRSDRAAVASDLAAIERFREEVELILSEARRAGNIVSNLLALARNQPPERSPVSLGAVIRQVITLSEHHLRQHNIALHSNVGGVERSDPTSWYVFGDAHRLQQALLNLVINAQQAISTHRDTGNIWINLHHESNRKLVMSVEDDGPGIPADLHETIFDAYYTTKPEGKGTGLGLSIATGIVASHAGELHAIDRPGGGATFVLTMPVIEQTQMQRRYGPYAPTGAITQPSLPQIQINGTVLLVDDEAGIRRSVARFLRRYGCQVETAATGAEALDILRDQDFDVMICDIRMPCLTGEELFELVRTEMPSMASRIVFVSGDTMREETRAFLDRCGCPSLQKPYELADLVRIIQELLAPQASTSPTAA